MTPYGDRKIIHIDMDAFYASIEQRDNPEYGGRPLVVGGSPEGRGVVAAASYESREFGIRSAMSALQAKKLCPQVIFVRPRISAYREVSAQIMGIFREITELIEPLSLDEAFLDVTKNELGEASATLIAKRIKEEIKAKTNLTASAGVAPNKFLAKIASDMNKPDGLTVISPKLVETVLASLPVRKVPGIGAKTEKRLHELNIFTTADLRRRSREELTNFFGKTGAWFYDLSRGQDHRPVQAKRREKSVSVESTFASDLVDLDLLIEELAVLASKLEQRLERKGVQGRTVTLKVTYGDFSKATRSETAEEYIGDRDCIAKTAGRLLEKTEAGQRPIRLLGVGLSKLNTDEQSDATVKDTVLEPAQEGGARQLVFPFF